MACYGARLNEASKPIIEGPHTWSCAGEEELRVVWTGHPAPGLDAGMERVELNGVTVEYELLGDGEPVVLPHARPFVSWYRPLAQALDRAVLRYRRSVPPGRPWRVEDDAALCAQLLTRLGVERFAVVGHSYGGLVALELARDHGVDPRSVALLEPAMIGLLPPEEAAGRMGRSCRRRRRTGRRR